MGYAEVSGLPAVYGLYGSVLPILLFACFSTSPQFIFGVDAAPAAIVGASVSSLGIAFGSAEAIDYISMIALCTGLWLLLFYVLKAGKMVDFISTPVMGGFVSGIAAVSYTHLDVYKRQDMLLGNLRTVICGCQIWQYCGTDGQHRDHVYDHRSQGGAQ